MSPSADHGPGTALRALLELALPVDCAGCGLPGERWCPACAAQVACAAPGRWWPSPVPAGLPPTWSALAYAGSIRTAVVAWKDGDRVDLTAVWVPVLQAGVRAALTGEPSLREPVLAGSPVVLVPAPSARAGTRRRGRAPVAELVRGLLAGVPPHLGLRAAPGLQLTRAVRDQAGLSAGERAANLQGAMALAPRHTQAVSGATVVLVDDVVTTGSTLVEATRALRCGGAERVVAVTLAATHRRGASSADASGPAPLPGGSGAV